MRLDSKKTFSRQVDPHPATTTTRLRRAEMTGASRPSTGRRWHLFLSHPSLASGQVGLFWRVFRSWLFDRLQMRERPCRELSTGPVNSVRACPLRWRRDSRRSFRKLKLLQPDRSYRLALRERLLRGKTDYHKSC